MHESEEFCSNGVAKNAEKKKRQCTPHTHTHAESAVVFTQTERFQVAGEPEGKRRRKKNTKGRNRKEL